MGRRGVTSLRWGRYDPNPPATAPTSLPIKLVVTEEKIELPDPMCDYLEGSEWWLVRSDTSIRSIQRAFEEQEIACCLYERVGAMLEAGRTPSGQYLIRMQIVGAGQWDTDVSLSDAGIFVEELWHGPK